VATTLTTHPTVQPGIAAWNDLRRRYTLTVPTYYNFAVDGIGRFAADPTRVAVRHLALDGSQQTLTFADLARRSDRLAAALRQYGVAQGDRVLLSLPRVPEWLVALLALMKLGAITIPCTILLTAADLEYRLQASGAKCVITCDEVATRIDAVAARCPALDIPVIVGAERFGWVSYEQAMHDAPAQFEPARTRWDDPCLGFFTSGTTAFPKLAIHQQAWPLAHEAFGRFVLDAGPTDLQWLPADNGWAGSAFNVFGPWSQGAALFVQDVRGRADASQILHILEHYPITIFAAVPTLLRMLMAAGLDGFKPRALRVTVSGGEAVNPEIIEAWQGATGITMREIYGQSESVTLVTSTPPLPLRPGSMGQPAPGQPVAIVDDDGHETPDGTEGHIAVRITPRPPLGLFCRYWGDEERTREAFAGDWYLTGDRASRDADGYLWFTGRADDIISSAAYRISPFEVENVLLEHPAVAEVAVVGTPDPVRGQAIKAFAIVAEGHTPSDALAAELLAFSRQQTAAYKCPRAIEFVTELPKTISGKIRRVELRERELARKATTS
jgi:acetyl-CoA synthetase/medium-chain acyl-CoA synthetase